MIKINSGLNNSHNSLMRNGKTFLFHMKVTSILFGNYYLEFEDRSLIKGFNFWYDKGYVESTIETNGLDLILNNCYVIEMGFNNNCHYYIKRGLYNSTTKTLLPDWYFIKGRLKETSLMIA